MTFLTIMMVLGSSVALGVPLLWLIKGQTSLEERDWLSVPFVGVSAAVLVLHTLVYFDWTVTRVVPWIWVGAGLLWCWMLAHGAGGRRRMTASGIALLGSCPWSVYGAALLVYLIPGLGLLTVGVKSYFARGRSDQLNYVALSQLLMDVPYSITPADVGHRAYLPDALKVKDDRIG